MSKRAKSRGDPGATGRQTSRASDHGNEQASLTERVGASASGLIQSSWRASSSAGATSDLVSLHASVSKGESSSSGTQMGVMSNAQASGMLRSEHSQSGASTYREPFQTQPLNGIFNTPTVQDQFDHFASGADVSETSEAFHRKMLIEGMSFPVASEPSQSVIRKGKTEATGGSGESGSSAYDSAENGDGAAVVTLLSNPDLDVDDEPSDIWAPKFDESSLVRVGNDHDITRTALSQARLATQLLTDSGINPAKLSDTQFTSFQQQNLSVQARSIPMYAQNMAKHQRGGPNQDTRNPHELIPDFGTSEPTLMLENLDESQRELLRADLSEYREGVTRPWFGILDKYHDEVWGDMLPLVQEAREEVRKAKESGGPSSRDIEEGAAVQRLKMVLQHLDRSR